MACLVRLLKMNYLSLHMKLMSKSNMLFLIKWNIHSYFQMVQKNLQSSFSRCHLFVTNKSLFTSGRHLHCFDLNRITTFMSMANWDEVLYKAYAKEGTLELCDNCFRTLTPGQELHNIIVALCLK